VFCVLGPLRVEAPRHEVRIGGVRRRGVLLRLLASPGRPVPVDVLAEDIWDGDPPAAAVSTLQSHISALRQAVGPDRLIFSDGGYRLQVGPGELDSLIFEADVAVGQAAMSAGDFESAADALDRALARWRGHAFADVAGAAWSVLPAGHLEEMRNTAVEEALEAHLVLGHHHEVCGLAEEAAAAEPLRERRWASLMLALYRAGRQADALAAYQRLRNTLAEQLGLDPSPRLSRLEHDILAQSPGLEWTGITPGGVAEIQTVPARVARAGDNLPTPVGRFVGRSSELAELDKLAGRDRLVTIVGAGGAGKTRLAIEAAAARLGEYRDGVWFVDLAGLSDPGRVAAAVAEAIGLQPLPGQPADELLAERVADLRALLVVDNCEHLVDAVATTVEKVLEAGPGMRVIATSRQPLRVPGERVWQTPPIAFPDASALRDLVGLVSFDAVRLFLDRAPELAELGSEELRVIAEITARLDGLPLAIELTAARAAQLDLLQLAAALQGRISLSWLGSRTAHARQQTLAATIGWSYDLLTPALQSALKRLSVFAGGFTLEAAAAVTAATANVTATVAALAERSLIVADRGAGPERLERAAIRYRMLETIRQYCAGRLAEEDGPDGERTAREAHSRFFADLARQAAAALTGWQQGRWLTTLEADHANLVAAVNHLLTRPSQVGEALQMIVHLDRFWHNRGHLAECATLLQHGLDVDSPDVSPALRCAALGLAGQATSHHDAPAGRSHLTECLQIAQAANDDFHTASALTGLARVNYVVGNFEEGRAAGSNAVELARAVGDLVLLGECLTDFGLVVENHLERRTIYQEALAVTRRSGDQIYTAMAHNNLGDSALRDDDLQTAGHHLEQARAILRELGHQSPIPVINLGWVYLRRREFAAASAAFADALRESEWQHLRHDASIAILGLACTAAAQHEGGRAACLLGFADAELNDCGASLVDPERTYREQALTELKRQLGPNFDRSYDAAQVGERTDLIDLALNHQDVP